MSLNDIELPAFLVHLLYKNTLVIEEAKPAGEPARNLEKETGTYSFLGQNLKRNTLIVNDDAHAFLPELQLNFLTKILEACKMNLADVAIVNHAKKNVLIEPLRAQLEPAKLILFGLDTIAIKLPFAMPLYKIQQYDDCRYLCASPLEALIQHNAEGKALKTKLWACLKELYGV